MTIRPIVYISAGIALGLVLVSSTILLIGAYYLHWDGPVVTTIANAMPIPAASVGKRTVLLRDYISDVRSMETYLSSPEAERNNQKRAMVESDKYQVLERLVHEQALLELAEARNIAVTDQQVDAVMEELSVTSTSTEAFASFLQENFSWTPEEFKTHVVHPLILKRLLTDSYAADHNGDLTALDAYLVERLERRDAIRYVKFTP